MDFHVTDSYFVVAHFHGMARTPAGWVRCQRTMAADFGAYVVHYP
jgi:hypothetical protein